VTLDADRRQRILAAVERWLDELAEPEPAPAGLAPEVVEDPGPEPDLFSVLERLTGLTREVQLQGRATNRLHADLGAAIDRLSASSAATPRKLADARREGRLEVVTELIEVRDRVSRGLDEAQRRLGALRGWRARLGAGAVLAALVEGAALARDRVDDALRRLEITEIPCQGKPFDPTVMRAVDVAGTAASAPGTVLEVLRPGYTTNGRVIRFAEVRVAGGEEGIPG
jgi:molecular chaperone GrpE (heat shock protein)